MNGQYPTKSGGFGEGFKIGFDIGLLGLNAARQRQQGRRPLPPNAQRQSMRRPMQRPMRRPSAPALRQPMQQRPFMQKQPGLLDLRKRDMRLRY